MRIFLLLFAALSAFTASASIVGPYRIEKTKNGIPVYFFESPNVPLFQIEMAYKVGSDSDPEGKSSLSLFAFSMLKRGVKGLNENALTQKLDGLAGGVEFSIGDEFSVASAFGMNDHADEVLDLLFKMLREPTLPRAAFERIRSNHLDAFKQILDDPAALVEHVYSQVLFNGTFRARPATGLRRDVEKLTLADVSAALPALLDPKRLQVLVVGGKSRAEVLDRVMARLEKLPALSPPAKPELTPELKTYFDAKKKFDPRKIVLIHRPELSEAHLRMGFLAPSRKDPDLYNLRVIETALSGTFNSRLNQIIREKYGLSYSVEAHFELDENIGEFTVSSSTRNEKLPELVTRLRDVLKDMTQSEALTPEELKFSKDYMTGAFPLSFNNVFAIATSFFHGQVIGLKPSFLDDFTVKVEAVTEASLERAAQKHFRLNEMVTVVVGDETKLKPLLEAAHLEFVTADAALFL